MSLRGYDGELKFDCVKRILDVIVVPRDKRGTNKGCGAASLSGGERSYLTVAFFIALWSCIDHPFFFLDEYDVFTVGFSIRIIAKFHFFDGIKSLQDVVNRSYITKLLLNEAQKHASSQFVFLTPLDVSDIEPSDILTILE